MAKRKDQADNAPEQDQADNAPVLVRMSRDPEQASGGPLTADVHPDEVENFSRTGWKVAG